MKKPIVAAACLGVAAALSISTPASADPKGEPIQVTCDDGATYWVTVNGNGAFTPGHDVDSTATLIPTSFGDVHFVITDSTGAVVDEFTDPAADKGSSTKPRATSISCTFVIADTFDDPDLGTLTFTGTGSLEGFVPPARGRGHDGAQRPLGRYAGGLARGGMVGSEAPGACLSCASAERRGTSCRSPSQAPAVGRGAVIGTRVLRP
jgi:hypothetical protein